MLTLHPNNVHVCKICSYNTKINGNLKRHIRVIHKIKPTSVVCRYCDMKTSESATDSRETIEATDIEFSNIPALIKRNAKLLHFLCTCSQKHRNALVPLLEEDTMNAIAQCNHNVIRGNIPMTDKELADLKTKRINLIDLDEDYGVDHLKGQERKQVLFDKRKKLSNSKMY